MSSNVTNNDNWSSKAFSNIVNVSTDMTENKNSIPALIDSENNKIRANSYPSNNQQSKKRTKASRACDQCRKKKIKCDYNDLKSICSNCLRNNEKCSFERVPLKRGPSKGYSRNFKSNNSSNTPNINTEAQDEKAPLFYKSRNGSTGSIEQNLTTQNVPSGLSTNPVTTTNTNQNQSQSPSPNPNSVLLPPLSQYINQQSNSTSIQPNVNSNLKSLSGTNNIESHLSSESATSQNVKINSVSQQQFWKVPYHEYPHPRKGSVDSLPSDISIRNLNTHEQSLYAPGPLSSQPQLQSANFNNSNPNNGDTMRTNSSAGSSNISNWYFKGFNPNNNMEEQGMQFRRSSSIPSLLRQQSNSIILGQPQLPHPSSSQRQPSYPYSQFHQLENGGTINPIMSPFGQYSANGFHSRNNSIVSDAMSPSADGSHMQQRRSLPLENKIPAGSASKGLSTPQNLDKNDMSQGKRLSVSSTPVSNGMAFKESLSPKHKSNKELTLDSNSMKSQTKNNAQESLQQRANSVASLSSLIDAGQPKIVRSSSGLIDSTGNAKNTPHQQKTGSSTTHDHSDTSNTTTPLTNISSSLTFVYGQISDVELIDIYYEFIHVGFPIIPLNKQTLTNDILLINIQPISTIHELNNYVILWFRNSLELLVRLALKKGRNNSQFFDNRFTNPFDSSSSTNKNNNGSVNGTPTDNNSEILRNLQKENSDNISNGNTTSKDEKANPDIFFEIQTIFISALNECFQKIVDIHPKFRENKDLISPKIKIIYLSTFIILNYILSFVGYDNSFVLGMSVTIFNEFKLYKLLLLDNDNDNDNKKDTAGHDESSLADDCSVVFKRLYILLIMFDSLQSCTFGGPKLLNMSINNAVDIYFGSKADSDVNLKHNERFVQKWCVEQNPLKLTYILQSLKLGELLTELCINRKSISNFFQKEPDIQDLIWIPKSSIMGNTDHFVSITQLFHDFLVTKQEFINILLSVNPDGNADWKLNLAEASSVAEVLSRIITQILTILTVTMRLNPTNSIDPKFRPVEASPNQSSTISLTTPSAKASTNDFYQRLLGLSNDKTKDLEENSKRGIILPFSISIIYELHNVINIIKQLPTQLIGIIMQVAYVDSMKAQEIVVKLSNSMNEVVQITSLLNMIKPFKIFDTDLNERNIDDYDNSNKLILKWKYISRSKKNNTDGVSEKFTNIGWKLLDDSELGWL